jgi:DNA (cytosine-5)-methyltransferase 1
VPLGVEVHRLLNTPTAADGKRTHPSERAREEHGATTLGEQVGPLLPTPITTDGNGDTIDPYHRRDHGQPEQLTDIARQVPLLPTPRAKDSDETPGTFDERNDGLDARYGVPLGVEVQRLLPTPTAQETDQDVGIYDARQEREGRKAGPTLRTEVQRLLPTPNTFDAATPHSDESLEKRRGKAGDNLRDVEQVRNPKMLPTPIAADAGQGGGSTPSDVTLTDAVVRTDLGKRPNPRHERLLPTPNTMDGMGPRSDEALARARAKGGTSNLKDLDLVRAQTVDRAGLLPTATTHDVTRRGNDRGDELLLGGVARAAEAGDLDAGEDVPALTSAVMQLPLIPTPTANDWKGSAAGRREPGQHRHQLDAFAEGETDWGPYAPAVRRAEVLFAKRPAPPPTIIGSQGRPVLSPAFVEWHMGLPAGWVTEDVIWEGMTVPAKRNAALKALGNGVAPPQCAAAFGAYLLDRYTEEHPGLVLVPASPAPPAGAPLLQTPMSGEAEAASNQMGVARRAATGQVFLTNQIASLCGLDPTEEEA